MAAPSARAVQRIARDAGERVRGASDSNTTLQMLCCDIPSPLLGGYGLLQEVYPNRTWQAFWPAWMRIAPPIRSEGTRRGTLIN